MPTHFTIIPPATNIRVIARGPGLKCRDRLAQDHGPGAWRKMSGHAQITLQNGAVRRAEIHWYEANGIGKVEEKIKRYLP